MKFVIDGRLDGLNEFIGANRTNKYKGSKMKNDNEKRIILALKQAKLPKVSKYPIHIKIAWFEPNARRDIDNICFSVKFIMDALVKAKIIIDDSQRYVSEISHTVYVDKEKPRIEVEIREV